MQLEDVVRIQKRIGVYSTILVMVALGGVVAYVVMELLELFNSHDDAYRGVRQSLQGLKTEQRTEHSLKCSLMLIEIPIGHQGAKSEIEIHHQHSANFLLATSPYVLPARHSHWIRNALNEQ